MKLSLLSFLSAILMLTLAEEASSAPQTAVDTSQPTIILRRKAQNNHNKRKIPDRQFIGCYLNEGVITLCFTIPEGECHGYITNLQTNQAYSCSFDSSELVADINIENIIDTLYIEFTTDKGNTYCGTLSI